MGIGGADVNHIDSPSHGLIGLVGRGVGCVLVGIIISATEEGHVFGCSAVVDLPKDRSRKALAHLRIGIGG